MKTAAKLFILMFLAAFVLTGCPCTRAHDTCGVSGKSLFFVPEDQGFISKLKGKEDFIKANYPEEKDKAVNCCQTFVDLVQGKYCQPKVNEFCVDKCPTGDLRDKCKGDDNLPVRKACYQMAYLVFVQHIQSCKQLTVEGLDIGWKGTDGTVRACSDTGGSP